jgi:hypothetical protein
VRRAQSDTDVTIVLAGEGAQPAAMIRNKQVDALSQFDTQYALIDNAGVKMRYLDRKAIERFPGNAFLALEETIKTRRKDMSASAGPTPRARSSPIPKRRSASSTRCSRRRSPPARTRRRRCATTSRCWRRACRTGCWSPPG